MFFLAAECKAKVDLGFIIDGSGSIELYGKGNFKKILNFVKELTRGFDVSKEGTHVGIVIYDHEAKVRLKGTGQLHLSEIIITLLLHLM